MSTLRVSNIEAKADASSPTINEKVKITNSNGDVMLQLDGATSGITTVGINTTTAAFTVDGNQNFNFVGIVTAASFSGNLTGNATGLSGSPTLSGITSISTTNLTVNGNAYPATGPLSNRNMVINGAMQVWQRDTAFASVASGGGRYTADRWNVPNRTRAARSTDAPSGFTYSLLIDREQTGGVEPFTVSTGIEVQDITQTGSHTLSFYAKSADITTLNINVQDRTGVAEGGTNNSSIVTDEAITIDNTWTRYAHTFTISSVSFTGTSLRISIGNTSAAQDDEALITGVQLEVGSVATPFEHRSYGEELARCERYFEIIRAHGELCMGYSYATTNATAPIRFRTVKRDAPDTITLGTAGQTSGTISFLKPDGNYPTTTGTHDVQNITTDGFRIRGNSYVGLTDDRVSPFYAYGNTIVAQVDAEL